MEKSSLGDRMKGYENSFRHYLPRRMPCIIRLDGVAFHTLTKRYKKPWDNVFIDCMEKTALELFSIQGCKLAYVQSDEISLLLIDYENLDTEAWFGKNIQKMCSVSASIATDAFQDAMKPWYGDQGNFDSRVFVLPKEEVCNYFIWRQRDCERNSLNSLAQFHFSSNELHGLSIPKVHDKLMLEKGINWNNVETHKKRGFCIHPVSLPDAWEVDWQIPIFSQDREYIEKHVFLKESSNDQN